MSVIAGLVNEGVKSLEDYISLMFAFADIAINEVRQSLFIYNLVTFLQHGIFATNT